MKPYNLKLIFLDYAMDFQLPKDIPKCRDYFRKTSYSKWAIDELYDAIIRSKDEVPIIVVKRFVKKMDHYSKISKNDKLMFLIAKKVGCDILDIFNAMS